MRLLVLGGTLFLGRHLVAAAQNRGHQLTLFNRGLTAPDAFSEVEQIHGDRERDLSLLAGRSRDAVIDTSGYVPRIVRASADLLADAVEHYTFVSSISAYGTFPHPAMNEDSALAQPAPAECEDVDQYYAELKAGCERMISAALGDHAAIVRPGLIVGPLDPTERFTYWVRRLVQGGKVLVPRALDQPVQLSDARDLAEWLVRMAEQRREGVFNATGPAEPLAFGDMLERIRAATASRAELVWIDEDSLSEAGVEPWEELPLWLDLARHSEFRGFLDVDIRRALAAGLTLRPLEDTVAATLEWVSGRSGVPTKPYGAPVPPAGLSSEREAELLARLGS